jgi:outer membrane cobalamin receptor
MSSSPRNGSCRERKADLLKRMRLSLVLSLCVPIPSSAQASTSRDLTQLDLEDLMNVQVTSVSKREQKVSTAGAAIYVITQEDIRRSGATNIPDLLRMVPGVNVARVDHSDWAVSIRGFNAVYANKVLVLVDGRSVYHPVFSGVLWYALDVPLENIERIEVIRGPGGTVWGANAMNGVINIITKSSKNTPGAGERPSKPKDWFSTAAKLEKAAPTGSLESIPTWERPTLSVSRRPPTRVTPTKGDSARTGISHRGIW